MGRSKTLFGAVALAAALLTACGEETELGPVIETPQGPVQGIIASSGDGGEPAILSYQGLPFAAPPVGDLRWRPPAAPASWSETRIADTFGQRCMQPLGTEDGFFKTLIEGHGLSPFKSFLIQRVVAAQEPAPMSEDCLYLNVRTPEGAKDLPVMVWIHGGGHQFGSSDFSYYQANGLPRAGVVLVTINYRLGAFGYMAHPALSADDPRGVSGNYGTLDQVAALEWVRDNIAAYGGDPERVTIFGESAGGWSVTELMSTPLASGLFHRAIAQSGASTYHMSQLDGDGVGWPSGHKNGVRVAEALGLADTTAEQLRALPAETIRDNLPPLADEGFHHVRDGVVFPQSVGLAFASGNINAVPFLTGYNADEGTLFFDNDPQPTVWLPDVEPGGASALTTKLSDAFPENAKSIVEAYALDTDFRAGGTQMMGDEIFGTNIRFAAQSVEAVGAPSWTYFFSRTPPSDKQTLGAFHAAEIPFVFDSHEQVLGLTEDDAALTETMIGYWANFARTGNPNGAGLPEWPTHQRKNWMHFSANTGRPIAVLEQDVRRKKLDLLSEGLEIKLGELLETTTPRPETGAEMGVAGGGLKQP